MLREALSREAGEASGGQAAAPRAPRCWHPLRAGLAGLAGTVGRHRLFCIALGLAVVPRVIAMLGYQPAILFRLDSYDYLWAARHLTPNPVNPGGYSLFLWLLRPLHSVTLVAGLQHLLGLGVAVLVYAVLRHWRVREWIAVLAAAPVLFAPAQILLEQLIMADLLALLLIVAAFAVLLRRPSPSVWQSVVAGLLMGASAVVRPTALPLIAAMALCLLIQRSGWRRTLAVLAAGVLPVVAYMAWFGAVYGSFNLTNSNGLFLWSRTMTFANCTVIKPPPNLQALCPERQPLLLALPAGSARPLPKRFLWNHRAWMWQPGGSGLVPDTAAFTSANNERALRFAVRAIEAQPLGYARAVAAEAARPFIASDQYLFPGTQPTSAGLGPVNRAYALAAVRAYDGSAAGIGQYLGYHLGTRLREPYAHLVQDYQRVIFLPGALFALIAAAGLAGILIPRRRTAAAAMLWVSAMIAIVLPIAEHEYTYRYVIPAIPLACMAAALAFRDRTEAENGGPEDPDLTPEPAAALS